MGCMDGGFGPFLATDKFRSSTSYCGQLDIDFRWAAAQIQTAQAQSKHELVLNYSGRN